MKHIATFCTECFEDVSALVETVHETVDIRGTLVEVDNDYPICPRCGERIAESGLMDGNLARQYDAYRQKNGIPDASELVSLRKRYGMSQRQLAALLGFGLASIQRYEKGTLPTDAHARLLRLLRNPREVRERLSDPSCKLSEKERAKLLSKLDSSVGGRIEYYIIGFESLDFVPSSASIFTGNRSFEPARLRETVCYLAKHAVDLYKTKLNKILFYLDFATFRDHGSGFTGLRFAHADYGPVPDSYELIMAALVNNASLSYREQGEGQVVVALRDPDMSLFSETDVAQLEKVVAFANKFKTAGQLSSFSHQEAAWQNVASGSLISYEYARMLKGMS